jgi:hypothetical protein
MIDRIKRYASRSSYLMNAATVALLAVAYVGVHTGHVQADIQLNGWSVGGGTTLRAEHEQQLAAIATALPVKAVEMPQHKPTVK